MPFELWIFWLILAVVLVIVELSTFNLILIWFCIGAVIAMLSSFLAISFGSQMIIFIIVSGMLLAVTRPLVKKIVK